MGWESGAKAAVQPWRKAGSWTRLEKATSAEKNGDRFWFGIEQLFVWLYFNLLLFYYYGGRGKSDTLLARFSKLIDYGDHDVQQVLQSIEQGETIAGSRPPSVVKLLKLDANRESKPLTGSDWSTLELPAALLLAW